MARFHLLAGLLLGALAAPNPAAPLILEIGDPAPKVSTPQERIHKVRPVAAGPLRARVVVDLDRNDDVDDLGPQGTGKDGIVVVGVANILQSSPWEQLRGYDLDRDGRVDAKDPSFSQIKIWVDADQDLVMKAKELHPPQSLGVSSLVFPPHPDEMQGAYESADGSVFMAGVQNY